MKADGLIPPWQIEESPPRQSKAWRAKKILVPTDFSKESVEAVRHAGRLAANDGAHLTLLTVIEEPVTFRSIDSPCRQRCRIGSVAARMKELAENRLEPGVQAHLVIGEGSVVSEIARAALEMKADLIVMGCHRHRGWWRWFRTRVITRVMACVPCPVMVINTAPSWRAAKHGDNLIERLTNQDRPADGNRCPVPSADASHQIPHPTIFDAHA
jgi:nucleotide-binding universal stress UspA family protein